MTKGLTHGKPQLARNKQASWRSKDGERDLEDSTSTAPGAAGLRGADQASGGQADRDGNHSNYSRPGRKSWTAGIIRKASTGKHLGQEAEGRLRTSIGELDDAHKTVISVRTSKPALSATTEVAATHDPATTQVAETHDPATKKLSDVKKSSLAIQSYNFGHESGYAQAVEDQKQLRSLQAEGVTPLSFRLWQGGAILLFGVLVGLIING